MELFVFLSTPQKCDNWQAGPGRLLYAILKMAIIITPVLTINSHSEEPSKQRFEIYSNVEILGYDGKCLDVYGPLLENKTPVQMWGCAGVTNQQWSVNDDGHIIKFLE